MFEIFGIGAKINAILMDVTRLLLNDRIIYDAIKDMKEYLEKKSTTRILLLETSIENEREHFVRLSEETILFPSGEIFRSILIPHDLIPDMKAAWAPRIAIRITTRTEKD